jgi:hypothetical protein
MYVCIYIEYTSIYTSVYIYIERERDDVISIISKENRQAFVVRNQPVPALLFANVLAIWSFTNNGSQNRIAQTVKYCTNGI